MSNITFCEAVPFPSTIFLPPICTLFFSSMGVLTSLLLFQALLENSGSLPTFVKYLITNVSIVYIVRNSFLLYKATYTLMSFFIGLDVMSVPYELCVFEQVFYIATSTCRYLSFFYISLNRLYATVRKPTALNHSPNEVSATKYLLFLAFSTWLPSILYYCLITLLAKPYLVLKTPKLCFCYSSNVWVLFFNNFHNISVILLQITSAVIYGIVYKKNRQILNDFVVTTVKNNLNKRFVQWANVKVSKWLIPLILISVTLNVSSVALTSTLRTFMTMGFLDATTLSLSLIAAFSFEAQIFPLLCIRFCSTLMQGVQQQHPTVYKWFSLIEKSNYSENFTKSHQHTTKSPDTHITSTDVVNGAKKVEDGILKHVGKLSDGKKKIVDHRLNPDAQAAILTEMWSMNVN